MTVTTKNVMTEFLIVLKRFESKKTKVMRDTYDNLMPVLIDLGKVSSDISDYKHAVGGKCNPISGLDILRDFLILC